MFDFFLGFLIKSKFYFVDEKPPKVVRVVHSLRLRLGVHPSVLGDPHSDERRFFDAFLVLLGI